MPGDAAAQSAMRKLEAFYTELEPDERKVIALVVSSSLQRAARAQADRDWLVDAEFLLEVLSLENAPNLVADLGAAVPGQAEPGRWALKNTGSTASEKHTLT